MVLKGTGVNTDSGSDDHPTATFMPEELMRFIQRDTYSLLIKGFAGTGKTILALTILRALKTKNNFFYISTRISPKQLFQYYPWLTKFVEPPKPSTGSAPSEHGFMSNFEDARLDEPESLFERITNQLMDIKSPIIIIDSWDAIASFMDKEARLNNERVLQTWRERAGAKLIFISEHPQDTTLDFLVDGIVELKQSYYENVMVREIFILKLRGVRINRPSYIYTLDNCVFRSFMPYRPARIHSEPRKKLQRQSAPVGNRNNVIKHHRHQQESQLPLSTTSIDHIRSGYPVLDNYLGGGYPRNGIVLLELDSHISTAVAMAFLGPLVSNFVSTKNPVLFQPFDWADPHTIISYLEPYISEEHKSLFKILWPAKVSGNNIADYVMLPEHRHASRTNGSINDMSIAALAKVRNKQPGSQQLLLNIIGLDILQKLHCPKDIRSRIEHLLSASKTDADLSVLVIRSSQEDVLQYLSKASDIHLKLLIIKDTLFLQPLIPASSLHAIIFVKTSTGYGIQLKPIV